MNSTSFQTSSPAPVFNILFASNPDGRDNCVAYQPVAVVMTNPDEPASADFYASILVKYLAKGKTCQFPYFRQIIAEEFETVSDWATNGGGTICVDNEFFTLKPIEVPESLIPRNPADLKTLNVRFNEETSSYDVLTPEDDLFMAETVYVTTPASEESPFIHPSPFTVKDGKMFATDSNTGEMSGPYDKVFDALNGCYVVANGQHGGIIGPDGRIVAACKYDRASLESGSRICIEREGLVGFYDTLNEILCEPTFTDIEFGDGEELLQVCRDGEWGYIDTNLKFFTKDAYDEGLPVDVELL